MPAAPPANGNEIKHKPGHAGDGKAKEKKGSFASDGTGATTAKTKKHDKHEPKQDDQATGHEKKRGLSLSVEVICLTT